MDDINFGTPQMRLKLQLFYLMGFQWTGLYVLFPFNKHKNVICDSARRAFARVHGKVPN